MGSQGMSASETDTAGLVLLDVDRVSYRFKGVKAVNECSLKIKSGCITGLIGPNGAGKSTAVNIMAGVLRPTTGSVHLLGRDATGWPPHKMAQHGLIRTFQFPAEFQSLSTLENLMLGAPDHSGERVGRVLFARRSWRPTEREQVDHACEILDRIGLYPKRNDLASTLSGGQRRLVELGRVLMAEPRVVLLDEPMFGLSPLVADVIGQMLTELARKGAGVLLVEHLLGAVESLCTDVYVLVAGKPVASGSYSDVMEDTVVQEAYLGNTPERNGSGQK